MLEPDSVTDSWRFFWHLSHLRFAHALAALPTGHWPRSGWQMWACYRLGMYATVANARWDGLHVHGGMAYAVSLAACGRRQEARAVVSTLQHLHGFGATQWVTLADALAPFMPDLALSLLRTLSARLTTTVSPVLHMGLLLRCGEADAARELLEEMQRPAANGSIWQQRFPELLLLTSNVLGDAPASQLERLNAFWAWQKLAPAVLLNPDQPPSAANLQARSDLTPVEGPLVSVLMTAFNAGHRIEASLRGLLQQTYRNLEVIVIEDASTDNTRAVVQAISQQDPRVRLLSMSHNGGTFMAKNEGFAVARGEFVTCQDSDDWSHPQRLALQVAPLLNNPHLVATTSQWVRIQEDGLFYARPVHPLTRLNPASPLFRKQLVQARTGLWDTVRTGADSEFHARLKLVFGRRAIKRLPLLLSLGAHRPDSLMNAPETGYDASGSSPQRLAYWEAWSRWHIAKLRAGSTPIMPPPQSPLRPFPILSVAICHSRGAEPI
ncbi:glycosyltransferase family 2 protein [Corticibacter populi]|uniref:Glycosyltransferase family 2 protein n=1 Tax=Corticibacter populi TaxID=1550736 RepID=A0A3M6QLY0_9BURK|nr:glycosyltransferase family A protein [Corticibacter populi]RMX04044.1 glycosyltransferase family 2 protein [Corticibacter populi]RZS33043.1 glycosyl transferase family 2 [Corticibacter populi]